MSIRTIVLVMFDGWFHKSPLIQFKKEKKKKIFDVHLSKETARIYILVQLYVCNQVVLVIPLMNGD